MWRVKKKHIGAQLHIGNGVTVLSDQLGQQKLKRLSENRATSAFIEKVPEKPEVKPESKKTQKKEVKDDNTGEIAGAIEADSGGIQ